MRFLVFGVSAVTCLAIAHLSVIAGTPPPVSVCKDITVNLDATGFYQLDFGDVDNGSTGWTSFSLDPENVTCANIGFPVAVTLTVMNDVMESDFCTSIVTVQDSTPPVISCIGAEVQLDATGFAEIVPENLVDAASDNCSLFSLTYQVDTSQFFCEDVGTSVVTVTVFDESGNPSSCLTTVVVQDVIVPVLNSCATNRHVWVPSGAEVLIPDMTGEFSATDICTLPAARQIPAAGSVALVGTNVVEIYTEDGGGNYVGCTADFVVLPVEQPLVAFAAPQAALIRFATTNGLFYAVDYVDSLIIQPQAWTVLSNNIAGTGGLVTVNDPSVVAKRTYRVRALLP